MEVSSWENHLYMGHMDRFDAVKCQIELRSINPLW